MNSRHLHLLIFFYTRMLSLSLSLSSLSLSPPPPLSLPPPPLSLPLSFCCDVVLWCEHYFEKLWISGSFSFVASVNLPWQIAALRNRQSSCCERISISTAAETSSTSFHRSRYSRALLLSLNTLNTVLAPDVCKRLCSLGIYDQNQACPLWKRQKRPYRAGFIRRGRTVDTIKQKHPLNLTRYTDKLCSCFEISDGLLPTNLAGHVCSAQLSDGVVQLGISPGSHRSRRPGRKRPYRGGRRRPGRKRPYCGGRRQQGWTVPVIVTDSSLPRTLHPLCTSTHDSGRPPTDKCSTAYGISYSNLIKIDTGPFIQEFSKHFKVMFLNAQSVRNKALDICDYITQANVDLLFLCETWLRPVGDEADCAALTLPGFCLKSLPRRSGTGGGLAVLHQTSLTRNIAVST